MVLMRSSHDAGMNERRLAVTATNTKPEMSFLSDRNHNSIPIEESASSAPRDWEPSADTAHKSMSPSNPNRTTERDDTKRK